MGTSAPSYTLQSTILRVRELELLQWVMNSAAWFGRSLNGLQLPPLQVLPCTDFAPRLHQRCRLGITHRQTAVRLPMGIVPGTRMMASLFISISEVPIRSPVQ